MISNMLHARLTIITQSTSISSVPDVLNVLVKIHLIENLRTLKYTNLFDTFSVRLVISLLVVQICFVSSKGHGTFWALIGKSTWKMFWFNMVPQISLNVRGKVVTKTTTFCSSLISSHKLIKVLKLGHTPWQQNKECWVLSFLWFISCYAQS